MKKFVCIIFVLVFILSLFGSAFAAEGRETQTIVVEEFTLDINTLARNSSFEKTMYLYKTGELEDGTMVMAFSETLPAAATVSIPVMLFVEQYSGRQYKVEVSVYSALYLIKSFYLTVNFGDGSSASGYATLSQITNGGAFAAEFVSYRTYSNAGTYTISIPSYTLIIYTDVYIPNATTTATINYSRYSITVS